jgi:uncharacterized membrane protein required for colicin V production
MLLDILFVILIGAAFYQGYKMGIIHTVFSIIGYALGVLLAVKLNEQMVIYLSNHWKVNAALLPYLSLFTLTHHRFTLSLDWLGHGAIATGLRPGSLEQGHRLCNCMVLWPPSFSA